MMQVIKKYGLFLILFVLFTGCSTIHEFPDDRPVEPSLIEVDITLAIDMRFYSEIMQTRAATMSDDGYDIRYIVDVYEVLNGNGNGNGRNGNGHHENGYYNGTGNGRYIGNGNGQVHEHAACNCNGN